MLRITESRLRQIIAEEVNGFFTEADEKPQEVSVAKKATSVIQDLFNLKKALDELDPESYNVVGVQVDDLKSALDSHLEPVIGLVTPKVKSDKFSGPQDLHAPSEDMGDEEEVEVDAEFDAEDEEEGV